MLMGEEGVCIIDLWAIYNDECLLLNPDTISLDSVKYWGWGETIFPLLQILKVSAPMTVDNYGWSLRNVHVK